MVVFSYVLVLKIAKVVEIKQCNRITNIIIELMIYIHIHSLIDTKAIKVVTFRKCFRIIMIKIPNTQKILYKCKKWFRIIMIKNPEDLIHLIYKIIINRRSLIHLIKMIIILLDDNNQEDFSILCLYLNKIVLSRMKWLNFDTNIFKFL